MITERTCSKCFKVTPLKEQKWIEDKSSFRTLNKSYLVICNYCFIGGGIK